MKFPDGWFTGLRIPSSPCNPMPAQKMLYLVDFSKYLTLYSLLYFLDDSGSTNMN